jgi:hypothetical protein
MEHKTSGNLDDTGIPPINEADWSQISIRSQSLDDFKWEILCDERWPDVYKNSYECHRITRRAAALGGHLYAVATHIIPRDKTAAPSVSESLIFVPLSGDET